jgi:hypothetical protein
MLKAPGSPDADAQTEVMSIGSRGAPSAVSETNPDQMFDSIGFAAR